MLGVTELLAESGQKMLLKQGEHFYYEAMVFLMNKQTRIIESQKYEELRPRIPEISQRSRELT
jgi:hypothetical protein